MNKNIFILFLCTLFAFSCGGIAVLDYSYTDDNSGGSGGDASGGAGGTASTSSSFNLTSSASESTTSTSSETVTETNVCDPGPKNCEEGTCFCPASHACCNAEVNPTMCAGNEAGYCCPEDFFCIPKGAGGGN